MTTPLQDIKFCILINFPCTENEKVIDFFNRNSAVHS